VEDESELRLIERARGGDVAAYEEVVRRYQELAFRVAYAITGSAADAEEAAQDGFVRAYHALGRFRTGAPLRPWLLRIVGNAARNRRVAARRRFAVDLDEGTVWSLVDPAPSPEAVALADEERRELVAAVNRLRADDRAVIACRYFLALSEAETAAALGRPRGTVKSRLSRALRRLREELERTDDGRRAGTTERVAQGCGDD
jgi:RNA polymerase sigma-70 factor (ECF subfamily)